MEGVKQIQSFSKKEKKKLYHSFLKGMSEILVLGRKPVTKKFYNYVDALNHDISFLQEDLIEALVEVAKQLPPEKKTELKNKLLEINTEEEVNGFSVETTNDFNLEDPNNG